ncbi:hypothetical protein [Streptomyces sp. NPDC007094]|uniref:hypothetical protein n=1 Tax=Streptomyces sp. NPDC007094 TaxID=3155359 RepID=UPI0033C87EE8
MHTPELVEHGVQQCPGRRLAGGRLDDAVLSEEQRELLGVGEVSPLGHVALGGC